MKSARLSALALLCMQASGFSVRRKHLQKPQKPPFPDIFPKDKSSLRQSSIAYDDSGAFDKRAMEWTQQAEQVVKSPVGSAIGRFYRWYLDVIERKPLATKAVTAAVVNGLGDILAQAIEASSSGIPLTLSFSRLQVFALCGFYVGPFVHTFYEMLWKIGGWLDRRFKLPQAAKNMVLVGIDQTAGAVIFLSSYFYVFEFLDALVHRRVPVMSTATAKIGEKLGQILLMNWYVWPLINILSFSYVPKQLRVLVNNLVGVLWNAFLCAKIAG